MNIETVTQILSLRASGNVQRCHTNMHHGNYLISEHIGQGITLLLLLHPDPSLNLIRAWTFHDSPELWTGDTPAPTKRRFPQLKAELNAVEQAHHEEHPRTHSGLLTDSDVRWLKGIDLLELYLWCRDQELVGNMHATVVAERVHDWMKENDTPDQVMAFLKRERSLSWRERCFE